MFTSSQSLCPARPPPSCPQKPWESRQNLPLDVHRPATDRLIRNSNVKYWKRFLGEILSLETGGMGVGGRSGSRRRGGWNPGPLPSSQGQERLFQRFSGNLARFSNAAGWTPKMIFRPLLGVFEKRTRCLDSGVNKSCLKRTQVDWISPQNNMV